ncbi:MAG TPA: toll/interleukin-1 receptor domain-containing protein [Anaerolineales bacterium]|nr:toll/interleukin-1 receptor domain-containing protein [Anaerolineales bacterium]HNQ94258.1 toll/interleukin-1 receptor domain-containing protein [Anaerolineales bacterium]HNS60620.1 toll/interleukin-1 receptor domain-containing protein [Anaerolineales bacterium]
MNKLTKQVRVFLIHAHEDRDAVRKLHQRLRRDSVDAWLDAANLQPGQDWQSEIRKAILTSDAVVVCLSRAFNKQHGYRHEELKLALKKASLLVDEVFIIPVRLEDCDMPESLRHLHRLDLFVKGGYRTLALALRNRKKV